MKDRSKSSRKKSTESKGAQRAKPIGSGDGAGRSRSTAPTGRSVPQTTQAQLEARFRVVFESSRDAIVVSKAGIHVFANPAHLKLFGLPADTDIAGKPVLDLIAPGSRDQVSGYIRSRILNEDAPLNYETRGLRADGSEFDMEVSISLYQENGEYHTLSILRDITERNRDKEKYKLLIEATNTGYLILDEKGRVLDANAEAVRMTGRSRLADILGRPVTDWTAPYDLERNAAEVRKCMESGSVHNLEIDYIDAQGKITSVEINAKVLSGPSFPQIFTICRDITARKKAGEMLLKSEQLLKDTQSISKVGGWEYDVEKKRLTWTDETYRIYGVERNFGLHDIQLAISFYPGEDQHVVEKAFWDAVHSGKPYDLECRFRAADGTMKWVRTTGTPEVQENNITRVFGNLIDITDRKNAQEMLQASESRMRSIIESIPLGMHMYHLGPDGRLIFIEANSAADRILGIDHKQLVGETIEEAFPPLKDTEVPERYRDVARTGHAWKTERVEYDDTRIKGAFAVHAFQTAPDFMVAAFEDITERRQYEFNLKRSEANYKGLYNETPILLHSINPNGILVDVNDYWLMTLGYARSEVIGRKITDFFTEASRKYAEEVVLPAFIRDGMVKDIYHQFVKKNGEIVDVILSATMEKDEKGNNVRSRSVSEDITKRRKLEEQLRHAQKMEAIGTLAGGIAHDFNNLLQGVFGYISLARIKIDDRDKSMAALEEAEKALHMSVKLTNQLLTFSKGGKPLKKLIDLRPVIENSVKFFLSGSRSDYSIVIDSGLWQAEADEGQIGQAIQNIVLNADQAMPEGGRLEITARNVHAPGNNLPVGLQEGNYVEITITDSGIGIPKQYLEKIFDPYFTTKEKGSGLGLATSYSIIKNHDGLITVKSEAGTGTAFFIYLPAIGEPHQKADLRQSEPATRTCQSCRVLVMDDETMIRDVAGALLKELGHDVGCASHGEEAIEQYRAAKQAGKPFDVVILDLTIRGGMGGVETLQKLLALDPDVKAVVSSGYSDDGLTSNYRKQGFNAFLSKPYTVENLRNVLNAVLARVDAPS